MFRLFRVFRRCRWVLGDPATWRDLLWTLVNVPVSGVLGLLPAFLLVAGTWTVVGDYGILLNGWAANSAPHGLLLQLFFLSMLPACVIAGPWLLRMQAAAASWLLAPPRREMAARVSQLWLDVAVALGSPSIRTHIQQAKDSKPDVGRAADTLTRVAEYAAKKNVVVHLENDDPVSEDPFFIVQVIEKVRSPWLRALPDFGNSLVAHDEDFAYRAIDAMFAHAYGICHVKDGEVSDQGKAVHVDLARTFAILRKRGYKGYCSIEYDAPGDPYRPTAELVEATVKFLS